MLGPRASHLNNPTWTTPPGRKSRTDHVPVSLPQGHLAARKRRCTSCRVRPARGFFRLLQAFLEGALRPRLRVCLGAQQAHSRNLHAVRHCTINPQGVYGIRCNTQNLPGDTEKKKKSQTTKRAFWTNRMLAAGSRPAPDCGHPPRTHPCSGSPSPGAAASTLLSRGRLLPMNLNACVCMCVHFVHTCVCVGFMCLVTGAA